MLFAWILFVIGAGLLVYTYLIYPAVILIVGSRREKPYSPRWSELPTVTILFAVHNEASSIADKLKNALAQDYPENKLDVLVVDDYSTDGTLDAINTVLSNRMTCIRQLVRSGKTAALNLAVAQAKGEILVFTDATTFFQADAVKSLIDTFDADHKIGVVCGEMRYQPHPNAVSDEESHYWNFERTLRRAESRVGTLLGAHGPMYAIPKELFSPLDEDMISDFMTPLLLVLKGYRTVNQPRAIAYQCGSRKSSSVYHRKRRIIQRSLYSIWKHRELLNPIKARWLTLQLISHKVLRWFTALWCLCITFSTILIMKESPLFNGLFWGQVVAYSMGVIGILIQQSGKKAYIFRFPAYVLMILGASMVGMVGFICGQKVVTWESQR
jgi:cellulose synthase/poly-beta-1,6-N-acetylglucosamine synthase-like glycosyltransferase